VTAVEHLAVYGSLQPGELHHDVVADLRGQWRPGVVRGHLHDQGWGAGEGYPAVVLDPTGPEVPVMVLSSPDLPLAWPRLDHFEGFAYIRRLTPVTLTTGATVEAHIYELQQPR
jgi:gamma-glutamylcyclotransferase (GGCT)/AIG2-like uncharacterized protein YtfP